jgi:hypothetical protein
MVKIERDENGKPIRPKYKIAQVYLDKPQYRDNIIEPKVGEAWVCDVTSVTYRKYGASLLMVDKYGDKYVFYDLDIHPLERFPIRLRRHNFILIRRVEDPYV